MTARASAFRSVCRQTIINAGHATDRTQQRGDMTFSVPGTPPATGPSLLAAGEPAVTGMRAASNSVSADVTASDMQARFPGWRVWRTRDSGTWYASRVGPGWNTEPRTLAADDAAGLLQELAGATPPAGG